MHVTVRLFAAARESAGSSARSLELPADATVADAERMLAEAMPMVAPLLAGAAFAVNRAYARRDAPLRDGDELAVLPPVSGG